MVKEDLIYKTNYIINFKTHLLPKYRSVRRNLNLTTTLQASLRQLKAIYDSVLNIKLSTFETDMDKNQKYVQPKAYLSSLLSFQLFKFYPDVYAILLNDIHLNLLPKTNRKELNSYHDLVNKIIKLVPLNLYDDLVKITDDFEAERLKLSEQEPIRLFQGVVEENYRGKYNIVNFLLWAE